MAASTFGIWAQEPELTTDACVATLCTQSTCSPSIENDRWMAEELKRRQVLLHTAKSSPFALTEMQNVRLLAK